MKEKQLNISEEYLDELVTYVSRSLVGKLLKRHEIIEDKDLLKKASKEIIYEEFRNLKALIRAHSGGLNALTQFVFKNKEEKSS